MTYGVNAPFGLVPLNSMAGGAWTEKTNPYFITVAADGTGSLATPILQGDLVTFNTAGHVSPGAGTIHAYPYDVATTANNIFPVIGVFVSCEYTDAAGTYWNTNRWPGNVAIKAGTTITAYVIDDPMVVYTAQMSTTTDVLADASFTQLPIGANIGIAAEHGGGALDPNNPTVASRLNTGISAMYLNRGYTDSSTTIAVLAAAPLKVVGYSGDAGPKATATPDSYPVNFGPNFTVPFLNYTVMLNNTWLKAGTAGNAIA